MTLKEELEILRGEPIKVFDGDPMDIPCIETSDAEKLCKHPVVSVHMITYNHEPYIRQAIEGVMMQKTDFEFELVIGEDASTDKTREICFEYQQKYPDKIRVLWWHENLRKFKHPAGGNGKRNIVHCRGEFVAHCEGDDYWIDPLKLQKQVDVMRAYPKVGFCFCGSKRYYQGENKYDDWNENDVTYKAGIQDNKWFFATFMFGMGPEYVGKSYTGFIMTATTMIRRSLLNRVMHKYDIFKWRLRLGDATLWLAASSEMSGYYISDQTSVYRISKSGVYQNLSTRGGIQIDGIIVRLYFMKKVWGLNIGDCPPQLLFWLNSLVINRLQTNIRIMKYAWAQCKSRRVLAMRLHRWYMIPLWLCALLGLFVWPFKNIAWRIANSGCRRHKTWHRRLIEKYRQVGLVQ